MYTRPTAPISIGGVLDDAFKLYRASFRGCWGIALISSAVAAVVGIYVLMSMRDAGISIANMSALSAYKSPQTSAVNVLNYLVSLALFGAMLASQTPVGTGTAQPSVGSALAIGVRRVGWAFLAAILFALAVVAGLVLLVIPGLYLMGALYLWAVPLYTENAGPLESLKISFRLISGHWWRSATILTVALFIWLALSLIGGIVIAVVAIFVRGNLLNVMAVAQVIGVVINIFIYPLITALISAIYHDLKLRREGGDLAARASSLQTA